MTAEERIVTKLAADATVVGMVGARIYGGMLPQADEYPSLSVLYVDGVGGHGLRTDDARATARLDVNIWTASGDYASAAALRDYLGAKVAGSLFDGRDNIFSDIKRGPTWDDEGQVWHAVVEVLVRRSDT